MNAIFSVLKLNVHNVHKIKNIYNDCKKKSFSDYNFELELLDFESFAMNIKNGMLQGFFVIENSEPKAFLLFTDSINSAVEINIIHTIDETQSVHLKTLLVEALLANLKKNISKKTISYPMMGKQSDFVDKISDYGFKFVNQSVFRFYLNDEESINVFNKVLLTESISEYTLKNWEDAYIDEVSALIYKEFSSAKDSLYDERFLSLGGSKSVIKDITSGYYGVFLPDHTKVLFHNGKCIGACLINLTIDTMANVPLIAVNSDYKNKGLGIYLLKNAVDSLLKSLNVSKLSIKEINATADSDNLAAVKMYKKLGFKVDFSYAHAYLKL